MVYTVQGLMYVRCGACFCFYSFFNWKHSLNCLDDRTIYTKIYQMYFINVYEIVAYISYYEERKKMKISRPISFETQQQQKRTYTVLLCAVYLIDPRWHSHVPFEYLLIFHLPLYVSFSLQRNFILFYSFMRLHVCSSRV